MEDYSIFFISHIVEPFLFFCITQNYFVSILIPILWEFFEYFLYMASGNYSILYLEEGEGPLESTQDILIYDIGAAVLSVYYGYTLYKYFKIDPFPIVNLNLYSCKVWWFIFLYIFRGIVILSPLASLGWECSLATRNRLGDFCPSEGEYFPFPPGLPVIALVDIWFIFYMFSGNDRTKEKYIALSLTSIVILCGCQRAIPGIELSMWILGGICALFTVYWLIIFARECNKRRKKRTDYNPIRNEVP